MFNIAELFNLNNVRMVASNAVPTIAPIIFVYLFLLQNTVELFILSVLSLIFLAWYLNFNAGMTGAAKLKVQSMKNKHTVEVGKKEFFFFLKDKAYLVTLIMAFLFSLTAFLVLVFNLVDIITWILLFLCIFAIAHYPTKVCSNIYVGYRYSKLFEKK